MPDHPVPAIEIIQEQAPSNIAGQFLPFYKKRWLIFLVVFAIVSISGLIYNYSRDAVYQATATILTVKPKAIDKRSEEADVQHVAIQERFLFEDEILLQVLSDTPDATLGLNDLRKLFFVEEVEDTNLLTLHAVGNNPEKISTLVNNWAKAYQNFRAVQIEQATRLTTEELLEEKERLKSEINQKHEEMQLFMEQYDIVSMEREENRAAARLKGLNNSINRTKETLTKAIAHEKSVKQAIARGETVVPTDQRVSLKEKRLKANKIRMQLSELEKRYTKAYLESDPKFKDLPEYLKQLELEIKTSADLGQQAVLQEARLETEKARQTLQVQEHDLKAHEQRVKEFSARFSEHKALLNGIKQLQSLFDDNIERLTKIEIKNQKKYPPVQIVNWARVPESPISPDYQRDTLYILGAALLIALFVTWLVEYLSSRQKEQVSPVSGIRVYATNFANQSPSLKHDFQASASVTHETPVGLLDNGNRFQALDPHFIQVLLTTSTPTLQYGIILLLNGVSPQKLVSLNLTSEHQISHFSNKELEKIKLTDTSLRLIQQINSDEVDFSMLGDVAELDAHLSIAAIDAGLENPNIFTSDNIWFSYVLFLVQQGARLTELSQRLDMLSTDMLRYLAQFSPPGKNHSLNEIEIEYSVISEVTIE